MAGDSATAETPSRMIVESFFGKERLIPATHGIETSTPIEVYFTGRDAFGVRIGSPFAALDLWTTEAGLEAIIDSCQSALVRARIALDEANGVPA